MQQRQMGLGCVRDPEAWLLCVLLVWTTLENLQKSQGLGFTSQPLRTLILPLQCHQTDGDQPGRVTAQSAGPAECLTKACRHNASPAPSDQRDKAANPSPPSGSSWEQTLLLLP